MAGYVLRRLLLAIPTLLVVSAIVFGLQEMIPGDAAMMAAGEDLDAGAIAAFRAAHYLDDPFYVRYLFWLGSIATGDFGTSLRSGIPVLQLISEKLPTTLSIAVAALIWALLIGIPAGTIAALKRGTWLDYLANVVGLAGLSVPPFWLGLVLILLVSVQLGWLPASGYVNPLVDPVQWLRSILMPSFVLGIGIAAVVMRHVRSSMLATLATDYVRTARAKGVYGWLVVTRHALRNALIPVITTVALQAGVLMSGTVLTEQVFSIPGFGRLIVDAVFARDYVVVQGVVLIVAVVYVGLNLLADIAYAVADPRLRR